MSDFRDVLAAAEIQRQVEAAVLSFRIALERARKGHLNARVECGDLVAEIEFYERIDPT